MAHPRVASFSPLRRSVARVTAASGLVTLGSVPLQLFWSFPVHTLRTGALPLQPRSLWCSPCLMIPHLTSSELNNNLGNATNLGLGSLHEQFFVVVTVFDSQAPRILSALAPMR